MLWASIILPITPPELLAAAISTGLMPTCSAVIFCRLPNSTFDDGVGAGERHAEPAQQRPEEGIEDAGPREGEAERRVGAGVARDVAEREHRRDREQREADTLQGARRRCRAISRGRQPMQHARERSPRPGCPVPVADSQFRMNTASSARGAATTGGTRSHQLVQAGDLEARRRDPVQDVFTLGRPQTKTHDAEQQPRASRPRRSRAAWRARWTPGRRSAALGQRPAVARLPERGARATSAAIETIAEHDVDEPGAVEVRDEVLRHGERHAGDEGRRPDSRASRAARRTPPRARRARSARRPGAAGPTIADSSWRSSPVTPWSAMIGVPSAPNATGAVLAMSERPEACERREAEPDQQRRGDRHRRAEAGGALEERAEAKAIRSTWSAPVGGEAARCSSGSTSNVPALTAQVVQEDDVEHDPADREQAVGRAEARRGQARRDRHPERSESDDQRHGRGAVRADAREGARALRRRDRDRELSRLRGQLRPRARVVRRELRRSERARLPRPRGRGRVGPDRSRDEPLTWPRPPPTRNADKPNVLVRYLPILGWLPSYERAWLRATQWPGSRCGRCSCRRVSRTPSLAGVPVQYGLYTAFAALLAYPALRHLAAAGRGTERDRRGRLLRRSRAARGSRGDGNQRGRRLYGRARTRDRRHLRGARPAAHGLGLDLPVEGGDGGLHPRASRSGSSSTSPTSCSASAIDSDTYVQELCGRSRRCQTPAPRRSPSAPARSRCSC